MWEYSDKVKEHYKNPKNVGSIENADAIGEAGALACGDKLKIYLKIDKNGVITDAKFQTFGCGSAVASSSILTEMIIGKTSWTVCLRRKCTALLWVMRLSKMR